MKKILASLLLLTCLNGFGQDEEFSDSTKGYDPTNLFLGGSLSLSLGGYQNGFLGGINPFIGYTFKKWIDAGFVVNFQYYSARDQSFSNVKYRSTTYGAGVFTRIYPVRFIFLQAQPEYNFINQKIIQQGFPDAKFSFNAPSLLVGAGYTTSRSDKNTFTYFSLLIDVLKDKNSPYIESDGSLIPVIRAGINFGLNREKKRR